MALLLTTIQTDTVNLNFIKAANMRGIMYDHDKAKYKRHYFTYSGHRHGVGMPLKSPCSSIDVHRLLLSNIVYSSFHLHHNFRLPRYNCKHFILIVYL